MNDIKLAVERALDAQPWYLRYKGTILIVVTGIIAIVSQLAASPDLSGTTAGVVLTTIATIGTAIINRFTRDGVTPSMTGRLEHALSNTRE